MATLQLRAARVVLLMLHVFILFAPLAEHGEPACWAWQAGSTANLSWNIWHKAPIFLSLISDTSREHLFCAAFSESSAYGMCSAYCAYMADLLEASQKLGPCCSGCSLLCTFPVTQHGSAFADRERGPGEMWKKHNELDDPHSVLCTPSSVYVIGHV